METCRNCHNAVIDVEGTARGIDESLARLELGGRLRAKEGGRLLYHHLFRVAIAGCPNSCSQPQIKDFGVQGRSRPEITAEECSHCGLCEAACDEAAVRVGAEGPVIDTSLCVQCEQCARVCPTGTIVAARRGSLVLAGGKLGRHPQLARTVADMVTPEEAAVLAVRAAEIYVTRGAPGERFGCILNRLGVGVLQEQESGS